MKFKCTIEITENELKDIMPMVKKIIPVYKTLSDNITSEIDWIKNQRQMILISSCDFVWDKYCEDFYDKKILPKKLFYKLIRHILHCYSKSVRISDDTVKRFFVTKA